jgi:hypothetical protein
LNQYVYNNFPQSRSSDQYLCKVSAYDEWPVIGATLGFPPIAGGDAQAGRPPRCGSVIAHQLLLLYNDILRHFELVGVSSKAKTDKRRMTYFEEVAKFIDENPESAEAAANALDAHPSAPDMMTVMSPSFSPNSPIGHDIFVDYIIHSAFDDPAAELVASSSTNPGPGTYDLLRPGLWKEIAGGDTMFHQAQGWKWEGQMVAHDQPWSISTPDVKTPTPAHTFATTPTSSTPVDAKDGGKRARNDDTDAPTPGVSGAPSPKRARKKKLDWERPPNKEARKRNGQAEKCQD